MLWLSPIFWLLAYLELLKEFLGKYFNANSKLVYSNVPLTAEERKQARSEAYVSTSKLGSLAGKNITTPAFIQVKIKPFIQLKVLGDAPFKILIVKDFDTLGSNQQAFRRLMEIYGTNCRMILITTKVSRIIDPIMSRCQIFLVSPVDYNSFQGLIQDIALKESLKIEQEAIEFLYKTSEGKISHAIDLLQLCSVSGDEIDSEMLYENSINSKNEMVRGLLLMCFKGNFVPGAALIPTIGTSLRLIFFFISFISRESFTFCLLAINTLGRLSISHFLSISSALSKVSGFVLSSTTKVPIASLPNGPSSKSNLSWPGVPNKSA